MLPQTRGDVDKYARVDRDRDQHHAVEVDPLLAFV